MRSQADDLKASTTRSSLPIPEGYPSEGPRKITAEEHEFQAYRTLRVARANARYEGARKLRAAKVSTSLIGVVYMTDCDQSRQREEEEAAKKK